MNFALVGYGRMGREIESAASARGHRLVAIVDKSARGRLVRRRIDRSGLGAAEVAFELTEPGAAEANVIDLMNAGVRVVSGTTGWDAGCDPVRRASRACRVGAVLAPNFSIGMNLFYLVVKEAGRIFGSGGLYDPFVTERHHRGKADSPSGTARYLAGLLAEADSRRAGIHEGKPRGTLPPGAVHVASIRAGSEPGVHTVGFDGEHDLVTLTHRTRDRGGFAQGAVLAAEWIRGRGGIHAFDEVLNDLMKREGRP